jgi:hypothetical protein
VTFNGAEIEVRQPAFKQVLQAADNTEDRIIGYLVDMCFVPGSNERVFEIGDKEVLLQLPFDKDMQDLQAACNEMLGVDVEAAAKKLAATQDGLTSSASQNPSA